MNKPILIKNGRVIDPANGTDKTANLLIINGRIASDDEKAPKDCEQIDASGMVVCPGFIDLHSHLRQPGFEEKETIASGSHAAAKGGFTTICCMPNTNPPLDNRAAIDYVKSVAASEAEINVLPIGCITQGRKGQELAEMAEMAEGGAIGFSDDGGWLADSRLMRQALEYSLGTSKPIISHCEDPRLAEGGMMNEGTLATRLGLPGTPAAAEEAAISRDISLAELTGAHLHIAHISTIGSVELIRRAKSKGIKVTCEVTPHHLTLTEEQVIGYDSNAKVNPPLRRQADIDALVAGLKDGTIDAIATDHAPHTEMDKFCEFSKAPFGISGLETALASLMGMVHNKKIDLKLLIAKLTSDAANVLGQKYGINTGAVADIAIFNPDAKWTVDVAKFASKGKNTPLVNAHLKGKVIATICGGRIVYKDDSVKVIKN